MRRVLLPLILSASLCVLFRTPICKGQVLPLPEHRLAIDGDRQSIRVMQADIERKSDQIKARDILIDALSIEIARDLAREWDLFSATRTNPHLVPSDRDIARYLAEEGSVMGLQIQFAAMRLVLDAADHQNVLIRNKESLDQATVHIVWALKEEIEERN